MRDVCKGTLEGFKRARVAEGARNATINCGFEVVRTVANRAARVWRTHGWPWLSAAPLIEMLDEREQRRPPYPITWSEQAELMEHLPAQLQRMALLALNFGARNDSVCRLRWELRRAVPEFKRSVFVIPAQEFKGKQPQVLVLNDMAWKSLKSCRGVDGEVVFVWRRERMKHIDEEPVMPYWPAHTMNNTAFQNARRKARLGRRRVHDLRHTFGQRLRDAGVSEEDRALLLGTP